MTDPVDKKGVKRPRTSRTEATSPEDGEPTTLEARLRRLEEIVSQLEADEVDVERSLALFEEGVKHVRAAEKILSQAELRVEELLASGKTRPLESDEEEAGEA